ncbi:MAG: rhamnulokinase, partial [Saccharothrix sp.]|nr:rhamnulokinase [Saccharothrix sp.]
MTVRVAAVDLGATSGRVMVGTVGESRIVLEEAHRFPNGPVRVAGRRKSTLHWDVL